MVRSADAIADAFMRTSLLRVVSSLVRGRRFQRPGRAEATSSQDRQAASHAFCFQIREFAPDDLVLHGTEQPRRVTSLSFAFNARQQMGAEYNSLSCGHFSSYRVQNYRLDPAMPHKVASDGYVLG